MSRASIEDVLRALSAANHATALEIASLPEQIRGYGHVKARHLAAVRPRWTALMTRWREVGTAVASERIDAIEREA